MTVIRQAYHQKNSDSDLSFLKYSKEKKLSLTLDQQKTLARYKKILSETGEPKLGPSGIAELLLKLISSLPEEEVR